MKPYFLILFIILLNIFVSAQTDTVYISGKVTSEISYNNEEAVKNSLAHLELSNNERYEYKTNDTGYYFFKVKVFEASGKLSIASDKNTTFIKSKSNGFLASKDCATISFFEEKKYVKDFILIKVFICDPAFPKFLFYSNNVNPYYDLITDSSDYSKSNPQNCINKIYDVLIENPTIVIELQGHCDSREKNTQNLSLQRAEYLKTQLVIKGIDKERILTKSWRNSRLLVKDIYINKAKTKDEKEKLHLQNRRVVFKVVSWDYITK